MTESGTIVERRDVGRIVKVRIQRNARCAGCSGCVETNGRYYVLARNEMGARMGDSVRVEVAENAGLLLVSALVFGVPMLLFFLGLIISRNLGYADGVSALVGVGCALLWYGGLAPAFARRRRRGLWPDAHVIETSQRTA